MATFTAKTIFADKIVAREVETNATDSVDTIDASAQTSTFKAPAVLGTTILIVAGGSSTANSGITLPPPRPGQNYRVIVNEAVSTTAFPINTSAGFGGVIIGYAGTNGVSAVSGSTAVTIANSGSVVGDSVTFTGLVGSYRVDGVVSDDAVYTGA